MLSPLRLACLTSTMVGMLAGAAAGAAAKRADDPRASSVSGYVIDLDGVKVGPVRSVEGGSIYAEVISASTGQGASVSKYPGPPRYEEFVAELSFGDGARPMYQWIQAAWSAKPARKNGRVVALAPTGVPLREQEFFNALITETTIPTLDASSKMPGLLTVKFAPERVNLRRSTKTAPETAQSKQQMFISNSFRLEIAGLDCSRVNRIESFTVKQPLVAGAVGADKSYTAQPAKLDFPNLKISLPEAAAQSFLAWHEDFVIKGNHEPTKERNGSLVLLLPDRATELARINFFNLGILRAQPVKSQAADTLARIQVEMYVERMEFQYPQSH